MKTKALILLMFAFTAMKAQTPEQQKYFHEADKELAQMRKLTIQGLKEARRWELRHLYFRQAHRTKIDIQRAKNI